jgi:ribosomal protein S18 acetylase RimI-like enzyme
MRIRTGTVDDIPQVLDCWHQADAAPSATDDPEALAQLLRSDPGALLVATEGPTRERAEDPSVGNGLVGTLIVGWDGWRGSYYRLAVVPEHRRRGIATALLLEGERRLYRAGARRAALVALTSDAAAVGFWTNSGYEPQSTVVRLVKNFG